MSSQHELIEQFLKTKRIAVVGVSRKPSDFSRTLWKELRHHGFDAVPVNPLQAEVDGVPSFPSLKSVTPAVGAALIMVAKEHMGGVVAEARASGVRLVWIYGIRGEKDVPPEIISQCREGGIDLIAGHCPFMFLNNTAWFHRLHKFGWKMLGIYPN